MALTDIALAVGIGIGTVILLAVVVVFVKDRKLSLGGWLLIPFGVLLVGLSVWKTAEVRVGPEGGLEAKFTALQHKVESLEVIDTDVWESKNANSEYAPGVSGFVVALMKANPTNRHVAASGYLGEHLIVSAAAQDSTQPGVPSITSNSFVMPVPKGEKWHVEVSEKDLSLVEIKWFTRNAKLVSKE